VDFYGTAAQVIPALLLALTWESDYLRRLEHEDRSDYPVFKKPVVRWWGPVHDRDGPGRRGA
jgi:hypothetical protein